ncbi:MAG: hypothetical protein V8T46_03400 [Sutterella seckii]
MEWQNMRYSQEFKDNVVARLLSKELSISEAVEQYSEMRVLFPDLLTRAK